MLIVTGGFWNPPVTHGMWAVVDVSLRSSTILNVSLVLCCCMLRVTGGFWRLVCCPVVRIPQVQSPGRRPQPLNGRRYPAQGSDTRAMPPEADRGRAARGRHVHMVSRRRPTTAAKGRHLHCQSPEADVDVAENTMWVPMKQYVVMCRQRPT